MTEKYAAEFVMKTLRDAGFEAFLVGGVVRDLVLGREPHDYDVTTNARPEQVAPLFAKTTPVGAAFGVVVVVVEDAQIQVATYRADGAYTDGRHPDEVRYSDSAKDDVTRRDFTMNGLLTDNPNAASWLSEAVTDYVGGKEDIKNKVIRCIGNPSDRFREDALRMLRAVRFAAQLGFTIETETYDAIAENVELIRNVSRERIREELVKLVTSNHPLKGLAPLFSTGLFREIFGFELVASYRAAVTLERFSKFPVGRDVAFEKQNQILGIAMLFVDAPYLLGEAAIDALKFSTEERDLIVGAITQRYRVAQSGDSEPGWLKMLAREKGVVPYAVDLFEQDASFGLYPEVDTMKIIHRLCNLQHEDIYPTLMVMGRDLIEMGFKPGAYFTDVLRETEFKQLNEEFQSKEQALEYAKTRAGELV